MVSQHKQKVHKTGFAAVPAQPQPSSSTSVLCRVCGRMYSTAGALQQHYKDTPIHPKCARCDIGFADNAAIQAHVISVHRPITCHACNGLPVYREDVNNHYRISPNHPKCGVCGTGFENDEAFNEHILMLHPELRCRTCNISFGSVALLDAHYQESSRHPSCPECRLSFEDNLALVKHVIAIFNPLIKDSGKLILKTSQMSLHDAFSDASLISRASRSSSIVRSLGEPSIKAPTPTRSAPSPASILQRQLWAIPAPLSPRAAPNREIFEEFSPVSTQSSVASISSPSVISKPPVGFGQPAELESKESPAPSHNPPEQTFLDDKAFSKHTTPLSAACSLATHRSPVVANSDAASLVSSAKSIFVRVAPIASVQLSCVQQLSAQSPQAVIPDRLTEANVAQLINGSEERVFSTKASTHTRAPSAYAEPREEAKRSQSAASRASSAKTVSPPPSHIVYRTPGQGERFRIASAKTVSRADSPSKTHESERFHSPEPEPRRQSMLTEAAAEAEPRLVEKALPSPPLSQKGEFSSARPIEPPLEADRVPSERFVSHIYCRMCRRDPCRQPTATMCGHIFCHQCISSEVVKTSRCPVCEAPSLLYSIFRLHIA
ncbi:hypothetical protein BC834DRAFT_889105 [Gloeopeniophorella convolvens]|nr:hypothetical protein BC834DRAFT_889105 [Gloeopeniophorella convolvens]